MHNWSTDTTRLQKNSAAYEKFVLEQRINFGLNNHKLSRSQLIKHWPQLNIDASKRRYLEKVLWPKS